MSIAFSSFIEKFERKFLWHMNLKGLFYKIKLKININKINKLKKYFLSNYYNQSISNQQSILLLLKQCPNLRLVIS
jgi:hypothetical protein